jgi:hypothetical protein
LIQGLHYPDDNYTLDFYFRWEIENFDFAEHSDRLQGSPDLHVINNKIDPRFASDSTVTFSVYVTAFSERLQRNVSGMSRVSFVVPPSPFGGSLNASTTSDDALLLSATNWVAGFAAGVPALPSDAPLRYEFFQCTELDAAGGTECSD